MLSATAARPWMQEKLLMGLSPREYVRSLVTPGNAIAALILAVGAPIIVYRFIYGLGAVTNLSQTNPWGLWVGLDVLSGVALAGGGFTLATAVYIFGLRDYHAVVRPALLTAFLGYLFVVIGLLVDLGRPWKLPVPLFWSWGTPSVMFEVSWCVALYTFVLALEFLPALFEWLDWPKAWSWAIKLTIPATIGGVMLSTLHQSSLGAMFLMAPTKLHPLWYSPFIPIYFFISAIIAGLTMVIFESAISHRVFRHQVDPQQHVELDRIQFGLARAAAIVLFCYFFLRLQGLAESGTWHLLATGWGAWYLVEVVGFVLVPSFVLAHAAPHRQRHACPLDRGLDGARHRHRPPERLRHRLQLERGRTLHPDLDGGVDVDHHHHHRSARVPVDRQPDADPVRASEVSRGALRSP